MSLNRLDGYVIRLVVSADVPAVLQHVREILAEFGIAFGVGSQTDAELAELPQSYASKGGAFWIATASGGRIVGTAGVARIDERSFELRKMYLSPETRGKGVGAALLAQAIAHAREHGARSMVLDTVEQMTDAIRFYERNGFVRDDCKIRGARCTRGYFLDLTTRGLRTAGGGASSSPG
jgi:GNAT superfamily N-acetyltransferase